MPPRPSFRTRAIEELNRHLSFAPEAARVSRLEAAEALIREIDSDRAYPIDFLVYRLTGYRPEDVVDEQVVGSALRWDLVTMIQNASRKCPLPWDGPRGQPLDMDAVAARLGCARRTLRGLRRRGLVFWWMSPTDGPPRLGCPPDMLEWFIEHVGVPDVVGVDSQRRHKIIATASQLEPGSGLADLVRRVAAELGIGESIVRGVLRRAVDRGEVALPSARRLQRREATVALRSLRQGVAVVDIARRLRVGVPSVHRALRRQRLAVLDRCLARGCLKVDVGQEGLMDAAPPLCWDATVVPHVHHAGGVGGAAGLVETLAAAVSTLRVCREKVHARSSEEVFACLDRALVDMTRCWWALLQQLGAAMGAALAGWARCAVGEIPSPVLAGVLGPMVDRVIETVRKSSVSDGPRLQDRVRVVSDRFLVDPPERGGMPMGASEARGVFLVRHTPWRWLLPDPRWERVMGGLRGDDALLASQRFALEGERLHAAGECARMRGCSVQAIAARTGWLRRRLRELVRTQGAAARAD
ncbi:MAG: hypothetical protein MK101_10620 [Phycisphaerales bacterium]|nr:hypothetical protein [Phycisphaerales bacterium]